MNRRDALRHLSLVAGTAAVPFLRPKFEYFDLLRDDNDVSQQIEELRRECPATSAVRVERGGPRLFINGKEEYPLLAGSSGLIHTIKSFKDSGIRYFHPLISLENGWIGPGKYDWAPVERYFAKLLSLMPDALFLPRLHLYAPAWWKNAHPDELVQYGLPVDKTQYKMGKMTIDSGFDWNCVIDSYAASLASDIWKSEMGEVLRDFLRHYEASPLRSRIIGYHLSGAMTAEWHYTGSRYLPDYSAPMQHIAGPVPSAEARMRTTNGLLRDPERERDVIEFYRKFHENTADTVVHFAEITKEETGRRLIVGTFFCYVLENVCIQEAGHLVPEKVLESKDIDYLASPYTYQHSNIPGNPRWESDVIDDAGNWLGRARGVGGDGGYRILLESLRRHGKLFISEMDPSTYLEPEKTTEGGSGFSTVEGTLKILRRDLAQVFASGSGGWLFEFGHVPTFKAKRGWYDDAPMINEIRKWAELGTLRKSLDASSVAQIAAAYDVESFLATEHWKAEEPWRGFGISISDFFNHWLLNSQARTLHRIGAPIDFIYRFDLIPQDSSRYKLFFMPNLFCLSIEEAQRLKYLLRESSATVVWFYAPGYITPDRFNQSQMEELTGFMFKRIDEPGSMMIQCDISDPDLKFFRRFGVTKQHFPRFAVTGNEPSVQTLGRWVDNDEVAFARREYEGFKSVYVGTGPVPVQILRWLATRAGARLWSSKPDIIRATRDTAMIVASDNGERLLHFPEPLAPIEGGPAVNEHRFDMEFGDVRAFVKKRWVRKPF
jgi:hypothetical protein